MQAMVEVQSNGVCPGVALLLSNQFVFAKSVDKVQPCLTLCDLVTAIHTADTFAKLCYGLCFVHWATFAVVSLRALFGAKGSTPAKPSMVIVEMRQAKPQKIVDSMMVLVLVFIVVQVRETAKKG